MNTTDVCVITTGMAQMVAALRDAVNDGNPERVATLLAQVDNLGGSLAPVADTLLEWAVYEDYIDVVRAALAKGASLHRRKGRAPHLAGAKSVAMAQLLIEHGADAHATWMPSRNQGRAATILHYLKSSEEHADVKRYFTELLGLIDLEALAVVPPMPEPEFWALVEKTFRAGNGDSTWQAREAVFYLRDRSIAEMVAFQCRFDECATRLLSRELWAFFSLVDGVCSTDVFNGEIPSRVIALGRDAYEKAVTSPDSLLRQVSKKQVRYHNYSATHCNRLGDAAEVAYRMLTGRDDFAWLIGARTRATQPVCWAWPDETWLKLKLPRTWQAVAARQKS